MAKGYVLYKIQVSTGSWVTLSGNTTLANIDFARSISTDPAPGSGVIAESITAGTGANVTYFTPAVFGYNDDTSVSSNAYLRIGEIYFYGFFLICFLLLLLLLMRKKMITIYSQN